MSLSQFKARDVSTRQIVPVAARRAVDTAAEPHAAKLFVCVGSHALSKNAALKALRDCVVNDAEDVAQAMVGAMVAA